MPNRTLTVLFSFALFTSRGMVGAQEVPLENCQYDRAHLLALDENQFDQDMSGGWRRLASTPGCALVAADLVRDYRDAHHTNSGLLFWHEAQLRAEAGQYSEAIELMKHAYMPAEEDDDAGWKPYVDATIAFLRRDRAALAQARAKLAAVPIPVGPGIPPVINGYVEAYSSDGSKKKMRWPMNIDVVEGLEICFDSRADLQATLLNYLRLYNHHIPQRTIGSKTPILALKEWQQKRPELFVKRVYDQTGLDT